MEQKLENSKTIKGEWNHSRSDSYIVDFKGRKYKKCTPTDLDWVLEISNKVLIIAEVKRTEKNYGLPIGQKILAENLCKYIHYDTIPVFYLYVVGDVIDNTIEIENSIVISTYSNKNKHWTSLNMEFKKVVDSIIEKYC
jgi:hypothetical protein